MIDHNHFICHFIFGGHLLNIPIKEVSERTGPEKEPPALKAVSTHKNNPTHFQA